MALLGLRAYARHRENKGFSCSPEAVRRAIEYKRLTEKSLFRDKKKKRWLIDAEKADLEWQENTDPNRGANSHTKNLGKDSRRAAGRKGAGQNDEEAPVLSDSRARKEEYAAKMAQLEYEEKIGKLVDVDHVKDYLGKMVTEAKTKLLGVPAKAKAQISSLTHHDVNVLEQLIRECLESLSQNAVPARKH